MLIFIMDYGRAEMAENISMFSIVKSNNKNILSIYVILYHSHYSLLSSRISSILLYLWINNFNFNFIIKVF